MMLHLGPDVDLPVDFATEGVVAVGMRGSGKSNTLVRWAEVLYEAGIPWVAIDPKGDWWGIRSSGDGKGPGLSVPVFGGRNGDFPLTEHLGADIANLLVEQNMSAVLDASGLSIAARGRFITAFCDTLMERHKADPHVRCVLLEEAHRYIPQQVDKDTAKVKEAAAAVLLEGRAFGLGCWAVTQRPARLNKDVLEEVGTVILHRIGAAASNDLRTIAGWVKHEELSADIVPSLTSLKAGECWILAPEVLGIAKRARFDRRRTFDSGATPRVGAGSRPTVTLAQIDKAAITEALSEAVEKAKDNDPRVLKDRLRRLENELGWWRHLEEALTPDSKLPTKGQPIRGHKFVLLPEHEMPEPESTIIEVPVEVHSIRPAMVARAFEAADRFDAAVAAFRLLAEDMEAEPVRPETEIIRQNTRVTIPARANNELRRPTPSETVAKTERATPPGDGTIGGGAPTTIMQVLAHYPGGLPKNRVAALAQIPQKKSTLRNALSELRGAGFVTGSDFITPTKAGLDYIGEVPPLPTGDELFEHWRGELNPTEFACFEYLIKVGGQDVTKHEIADYTGIDPEKSTLRNALSRLRTLGLMQGMHADPDVEAAINA